MMLVQAVWCGGRAGAGPGLPLCLLCQGVPSGPPQLWPRAGPGTRKDRTCSLYIYIGQ